MALGLRRLTAASCAQVVQICTCVLRALAHLHASGIVHRDLKPENLCLGVAHDYSTLKLCELGCAREFELDVRCTTTNIGSAECVVRFTCRALCA